VRGLARAARLSAAVGHQRPHEPHWYLATIGVSGSARGLGVGSALLESRLAVLDAAHQIAYLESSAPANRRLYVRHGFQQTTALDELTGTEAVGMRRDPRA
jgi:ribosomal protein S18 acetylase RimI-like enzyme